MTEVITRARTLTITPNFGVTPDLHRANDG